MSIDNLKKKENPGAVKALALLHLFAATLVTAACATVATLPAYLQLRAEYELPPAERVDELRQLREAARSPASTGSAVRGRVAPAATPASR